MNTAPDAVEPLKGVPETMLLTLWGRSAAASGKRKIIDDPVAVDAAGRLGFDFASRFGKPSVAPAVRSLWSDELVRRFLARHPKGTVVALGEGLETQFWRVDNGWVRWISVDLPESVAIRRRVLPSHERLRIVEASANDPAWLDEVPEEGPIFITASGLLMYLERAEVIALLKRIGERFRRAELFFDTVPGWVSRRSAMGLKIRGRYTVPLMPFGLNIADLGSLLAEIPGLRQLSVKTYGEPYPRLMPFIALFSYLPRFRNRWSPALIHAQWT